MTLSNYTERSLNDNGIIPLAVIAKGQQVVQANISQNINTWLRLISSNAEKISCATDDPKLSELACDIIGFCMDFKDFSQAIWAKNAQT